MVKMVFFFCPSSQYQPSWCAGYGNYPKHPHGPMSHMNRFCYIFPEKKNAENDHSKGRFTLKHSLVYPALTKGHVEAAVRRCRRVALAPRVHRHGLSAGPVLPLGGWGGYMLLSVCGEGTQ